MTISKLAPVLCALAVGALCLTTRAEDNPAQAAARAALAKELFGSSAQQAPNAPSANPPASSKEAKAKQDAQNAAALKARQEAEAKAAAARANQEAAAQPKAKAEKPASNTAPQPVTSQTAMGEDNPAQAAARIALAKQLFGANPQPAPNATSPAASSWATAPATESKQVVVVKKEEKPNATPVVQPAPVPQPVVENSYYPGKELGLKPISAPALPISASKAERLQALLEKYKADQITPEEYHQQRAAILAEP